MIEFATNDAEQAGDIMDQFKYDIVDAIKRREHLSDAFVLDDEDLTVVGIVDVEEEEA
jgi:hypothetical protein